MRFSPWILAALLAALLSPGSSRAQVVLGARTGVAFGAGDVGGALAMGDWVSVQVPVQVEALYRVRPRVALGAYLSYGFGRTGGDLRDACAAAGSDCSASVVRLGGQAEYAFAPRGRWEPWAGAALGYEWNRLEASETDADVDATFRGLEYLTLQGGVELRPHARFSVGPFVMVSVGQYDEVDTTGAAESRDRSVPEKRTHAWLGFGVRGRIAP